VFAPDADLASALHRRVLEHPDLGAALRAIGLITHPHVLRLIALVAAIQLWRHGRARAAGWLLLTMALGGVLGAVLKLVFTRSRPQWPESITVISGYSFPSGHALNSMLAAGCAIVLLYPRFGPAGRRRLGAAAGVFVVLVGVDRLALGVHYLTDVLAAWTLALAVLFATLAAFGPLDPLDLASDSNSDTVPSHAPVADRPPHAVPTDPGPPRGGDRGDG
jgi:undecaprenyl-diphosphatase